MRHLAHSAPGKTGRESGQAMIEYLVVLAFGVMLLTRPYPASEIDPNATGTSQSAIEQLANSVKQYHKNYTYAMAIAYIPNCTYTYTYDVNKAASGIWSGLAGIGLGSVGATVDRCIDLLNPSIPTPTLSATGFNIDFQNAFETIVKTMIENAVQSALDSFLPENIFSGLLKDFDPVSLIFP